MFHIFIFSFWTNLIYGVWLTSLNAYCESCFVGSLRNIANDSVAYFDRACSEICVLLFLLTHFVDGK